MFDIQDLKYKDILYIPRLKLDTSVTCIVGASGSGKTTFLKLLNKIYKPDEGKILYKGQDVEEMDSVFLRRQVVMLLQNPIIYQGTIKDNLIIGLLFSKKNIPDDKVLIEYLDRVKLNRGLEDGCIALSGGEKQRLCLARVLLMDADTYLFDEPSSALDKDTEKTVINLMLEYIRERNKQCIIVTHSNEVTKECAASIVEIKYGMAEYKEKVK